MYVAAASKAVAVQGCYRDNPASRDLPVEIPGFDWTLTPSVCVAACRNASHSYAGLQVTSQMLLSVCHIAILLLSRVCHLLTTNKQTNKQTNVYQALAAFNKAGLHCATSTKFELIHAFLSYLIAYLVTQSGK